jgi:hypothetical protein
MRPIALNLASTTKNSEIGAMAIRKMKFVLVNGIALRGTSICPTCSRPLGRGYLHDLSTSRRYCGIACYPRWMAVDEFVGSFSTTDLFELAVAWPKLTVDVATALFDSAWRDHGD